MSKRRKFDLLKYGITGGLCLVFAVSYILSQGFLSLDIRGQLRVLSDAFTIPGLICVFAGVMVWAVNEGSFLGIGYVIQYVFQSLMPGIQKRENYREYRERMMEKKILGYGFLFVVGLACLAVTAVFLVLFHML